MSILKRSLICAVCLALCVVLPMVFHAIPQGGVLFSPMHLPVLLCGIVSGWCTGLLCGIAGPLLSFLFTGMPGIPMLPQMITELACYGLFSGLMMALLGNKKGGVLISLLVAMAIGRVIAGLARAFIFTPGAMTFPLWIASYFVSCLPAIVMQLVLIPLIYAALKKTGFISKELG